MSPSTPPHTPLQAPDRHIEPYADLENELRRTYAAMVSAMDEGVGKILASIEEEGLTDDTLVVWASDNGGGRNVGASNLPLRGSKGNAFEGGIRVPATIRWPGVLAQGETFDQMITAEDWFQTLASAAGVESRNTMAFDGIDMWGALKDQEQPERQDVIIGVEGNYAVFREGWKLVTFTRRGTNETATHLFRIADDPYEERDLIDVKPDLAKELTASLQAFPRAPSVGSDDVPARPRGGNRGAKKAGGRPPGNPAAFQGAPRETREPWLETAIKD